MCAKNENKKETKKVILTSMKTSKDQKKKKNSSITQNLGGKKNLNSGTVRGQKRERTVHFKKKALRSTKHSMEGSLHSPKANISKSGGTGAKDPTYARHSHRARSELRGRSAD